MLEEVGADTLRVAMLYAAAPKNDFHWTDEPIRYCAELLAAAVGPGPRRGCDAGRSSTPDARERIDGERQTAPQAHDVVRHRARERDARVDAIEMKHAVEGVIALFGKLREFERQSAGAARRRRRAGAGRRGCHADRAAPARAAAGADGPAPGRGAVGAVRRGAACWRRCRGPSRCRARPPRSAPSRADVSPPPGYDRLARFLWGPVARHPPIRGPEACRSAPTRAGCSTETPGGSSLVQLPD